MLSVDNLCIGYPRRTLASAISFTLATGQALAILGPNGSGKTTLFRTLLGLLPARAGTIHLDDIALDQLAAAAIAKRIAYVPQNASAVFNFNVIEMVEMARAPHLAWYARPSKLDRDLAWQALEKLNIARFAFREMAELSGGERQLVLIARALTAGAPILLLDEPTASLDFGNRLMIEDQLQRLKADGLTLVFTTHDPDQAWQLCGDATDRTLTIARDGQVAIGATRALLTAAALATLYGVAERVLEQRMHFGNRLEPT